MTGPAIASGFLAAALFMLTAIFTTWDVLGRWLFHAPTAWALELTTYAFMMGAFLGGPYAMYRGEHVLIEMLVNALPNLPRRFLHISSLLFIMTLFGYLTWHAINFSYSSYSLDLRSPILNIPIWPVQAIVPLAFALIFIESTRQFSIAFLVKTHIDVDSNDISSIVTPSEVEDQKKRL